MYTYMQNIIHKYIHTNRNMIMHSHIYTYMHIHIYTFTDIHNTETQTQIYTYVSTHTYTQIPPHSLHTHTFHVFEKVLLPFFRRLIQSNCLKTELLKNSSRILIIQD